MNAVLEKSLAVLDANIAARNNWPVLNPLPEPDADVADPFPFAALGHNLNAVASAIATGVQAPDAIAAGSVLAAVALAVQPLANVAAPYGARVPLSLYILTSASSGDRKSAVDAIACHAVEEMRKKLRKPLTDRGKELILKKLEKLAPGDEATQAAILDQSVERGWQGVFPLKTEWKQRGSDMPRQYQEAAKALELIKEYEDGDGDDGEEFWPDTLKDH